MYLGNAAKLKMIAKPYVTLRWRPRVPSAMAFFHAQAKLPSCDRSDSTDCSVPQPPEPKAPAALHSVTIYLPRISIE